MPPDPQAKALLDLMAAMACRQCNPMSVEQIRQWVVAGEARMGKPGPAGSLEDREIPGPGGSGARP